MPDLAAIKRALAAATPGPWELAPGPRGCAGRNPPCAECHLLLHAPQWLSELVAEVERQAAEIEALRDGLREALYEWGYASGYKGEHLAAKHGDAEAIAEIQRRLLDGAGPSEAQRLRTEIASLRAELARLREAIECADVVCATAQGGRRWAEATAEYDAARARLRWDDPTM